MSRDFRLFFRLIFFIPFFFVVFLVFRGYANTQFIQSLERCTSSESGESPSNVKNEQANMKSFLACLQRSNNPIVWWYIKPKRLNDVLEPHTPCQWVGRWQAKRDKISFAIEIKANGKFMIDSESMAMLNSHSENHYTEGYSGIWSSPNKNTIVWFTRGRIWPIDENKVDWLNTDQLVIHELNGEKTYYQRQSAHIENCPYYP